MFSEENCTPRQSALCTTRTYKDKRCIPSHYVRGHTPNNTILYSAVIVALNSRGAKIQMGHHEIFSAPTFAPNSAKHYKAIENQTKKKNLKGALAEELQTRARKRARDNFEKPATTVKGFFFSVQF